MRCPKCKNTALDKKHTFCFDCGTKLEPDDRDVTGDAKELSRVAQSSDVDDRSDVSLGKILF